ncbi:MAG: PD-(D/E)XK nuclease family protein [Puniceicoccales bacterium]|jgi:hypothetical protein|nr:PD-(D/E)XK nuclease family protein [Puniceicoccales bacterium]
MAGFISNNFSSIKNELLSAISQIDPLAPLPSLILCHSSIGIKFLKYLLAQRQIPLANVHFHTFHTLIGKLFTSYFPQEHIVRYEDIKFLAQNEAILPNPHALAKAFLEPSKSKIHSAFEKAIDSLGQQIALLRWTSPDQALKKMIPMAQATFSTCILYGYSSRENYSSDFLTLIKKISQNVLFFAFDRGDQERDTFEKLEAHFGKGENIYKNVENHETHFSIVGDSIDGARYCGALISDVDKTKTVAVVCSSDVCAKLVAHELSTRNIRHHNGFQMSTADPGDHFIFAWYSYQLFGDLEHFLFFLDLVALEDPPRLSGNYYAYLSHLFHRYPIHSIERLAPSIEDPQIVEILRSYPLLPEGGPMDEFVRKTIPLIPEIGAQTHHFHSNLPVRKEAFLEYALAVYGNAKPSRKEPFYAPIFIGDPYSATQFHFDHLILLGKDIAKNNETAEDDLGTLFPFLSADTIHLIAEKNNIPTHFAQQYQAIHRQILNPQAIQLLVKSFTICDEIDPKKYECLGQINGQRSDESSDFGSFEYVREEGEILSLPITAIERAFTDPEEIWYRHVLKNDRPLLQFDGTKFAGIFTHQFLKWPSEIRPSLEAFKAHITQKQRQLQGTLSKYSPGLLLQKAMEVGDAYVLAEKIAQLDTFPFLVSEVELRSAVFLDGRAIPLHGRVDCILSKFPFRKQFHGDNGSNSILVIDLKTGSTTQGDLLKLMKPFSDLPVSLAGLQLVLYGLILENLGYKNIQLLICNADPYDRGEPITLRAIEQSENFPFIQNFLKKLLGNGIFGYGEENPFLQGHFPAPIATIPPKNRIIREKRRKLFLK